MGVVSTPAMGYSVVMPRPQEEIPAQVNRSPEGFAMENEFVVAKFDQGGQLTNLFDKQNGRECIQPGQKANQFVLFDDNPVNFDAWDVDIFHLEKFQLVAQAHSANIIENGPLRVSLEFEADISPKSKLRQVVSLTALSPKLEFSSEIDWHEDHKFLKVEFPLTCVQNLPPMKSNSAICSAQLISITVGIWLVLKYAPTVGRIFLNLTMALPCSMTANMVMLSMIM